MTETKWGPWIDWHGGECPIPWAKAGEYTVKFGDGDERSYNPARAWRWKREGESLAHCLTAYRVTAYRVRADLMDRVAPAAAFVPSVATNKAAGYREFVTADRPTVTQDADGYSLLLDMETRVPVGVRWAIVPAAATPDVPLPSGVRTYTDGDTTGFTYEHGGDYVNVEISPHGRAGGFARIHGREAVLVSHEPDVPATDPVVEAMAEALRALGGIADDYDDHEDDNHQVWVDCDVVGGSLRLKFFRAARAALAAYEAQKEGRGS